MSACCLRRGKRGLDILGGETPMQYQVAAGTVLASFALLMASSGETVGGLVGIGAAGLVWPAVEYTNHLLLHEHKSARHMHHHQHSRDYPEVRVNLGPLVATFHLGATLLLWWFGSWAMAMGYSGTSALLYSCYEGAHEGGHLAPITGAPLTWAVQNSHAWHWRHHQKPGVNFGVSTPFYDYVHGTADARMLARYTEGWRRWLLPLPWVVFALTRPDPNAAYDQETHEARQVRSADARRRQKGGSFSG